MIYFGAFAGSFVLPRLADLKGRKPLFLSGLALYIFAIVFIVMFDILEVIYVLLFIAGISEAGRYYVGYVYMVEFQPLAYQSSVGLSIFIVHAFVKLFYDLYFAFISKQWLFFGILSIAGSVTCFCITTKMMIESPRWLIAAGKKEEAVKVFKYIQRKNSDCDQDKSILLDTHLQQID